MSSFPLYDTLNINLPKGPKGVIKDLTTPQKNDMLKKIEKLDQDGYDLMYALIKCYYLDNTKGNILSIPYKGKLNKDRIDFNLLDLPVGLRQLLYKFLLIHYRKLIEDEKINLAINSISCEEI